MMKRTGLQPFRGRLRVLFHACLAMIAAIQVSSAQEVIVGEPEIIIDDADFIEVDPLTGEPAQQATPPAPESKEDGQILNFADGNTLHGTLSAVDSQRREIIWSRTDLSTPLTLPIGTVTSLTLANNPEAAPISAKATVKFSGSDWVTGDVIGLNDGKLQVRLSDSSTLVVEKDRVEWIYFAKTTAPECYDGPTSMAGWNSDGSWIFREGALRALRPGPVGRFFEALPDRVEYFFEVDQHGDTQAFSVNLRGTQVPATGVAQGRVQLMFSSTDLRLWAQIGDEMKMEQVDLRAALGMKEGENDYRTTRRKPVQYRLLEDFPGGRLVVMINGKKVADWNLNKGEAGKHKGGFTFQPMIWDADAQQSISRVRVLPWDGVVPANGTVGSTRDDIDSAILSNGEQKDGELLELTGTGLRLGSSGASTEIPREQVTLLRFRRPENPPDEDVPVAHVRLARRGEFYVSEIDLQAGQLATRTTFGGTLAFPLAAIRTVEFFGAGSAPATPAADLLIFKNGDRLRGTLDGLATGQPIRWRTVGGKAATEFQPGKITGVLLAKRPEQAAAKSNVVARFRNGDLLPGDFIELTNDHLSLKSNQVGSITVARDHLQTLFFANDGTCPVLDGATGSELWMSGSEFRRPSGAARDTRAQEAQKATPPSPWRYFDGAFTFQREGNMQNRGGLFLGRVFEAMPQSVEISFLISSVKAPTVFSIQLFSEPSNAGYMMQFYAEGIFLHDMAPRGKNRTVFQQQFAFDDKVPKNATQRRIRILADRPSGKVTFLVDGSVVGQVTRKPSDGPRNLGRGFMLMPQTNAACTFSDLWIGPWNGQVPGREPAAAAAADSPHSVLLANGDESRGTIQTATPEMVKFESEAGPIELPTARTTMLDFGASAAKPERGARLRLTERGSITVSAYRSENGQIICQSPVVGELRLPLSAIQEISLDPVHAQDGPIKKAR